MSEECNQFQRGEEISFLSPIKHYRTNRTYGHEMLQASVTGMVAVS